MTSTDVADDPIDPPDGISDDHARPAARWRQHASPISLSILAIVMVLGLSGLLGHERAWSADDDAARLRIEAPEVIRNGEFFEMRIRVTAVEPIADPVVVVEAALWEDMTVNTMLPAPTEEESVDGMLRFTFAPLEAGSELLFKVDLQVNPDILGANAGAIAIADGEESLASTDVTISVLP
jgi:hypothetical protein